MKMTFWHRIVSSFHVVDTIHHVGLSSFFTMEVTSIILALVNHRPSSKQTWRRAKMKREGVAKFVRARNPKTGEAISKIVLLDQGWGELTSSSCRSTCTICYDG